MKTFSATLTVAFLALILTVHTHAFQADPAGPEALDLWGRVKTSIDGYLGRPYVWGACGLKSFDCSGFVWRVMFDNGMFFKRTTARKLYMSLPKSAPGEIWNSGNIVFFNNLKHCGIVCNRDSFYHAQTTVGTNLSLFDSFWRPKIVGFRRLPEKD